jgi:hypothetical protein
MRGLVWSVILGILIAVWSVAVMPFFAMSHGLGIAIPCLVLLLMGSRPSRLLLTMTIAGMIIDSYSLSLFEAHTAQLLLLSLTAWVIFARWLTNRSMYSAVALALILSLFERLMNLGVHLLGGVVVERTWSWMALGVTLVWNTFVTALGFMLIAALSQRLSLLFTEARVSSRYG